MLLLYYYYIIIIFLLLKYYEVIIMFLFLGKKVTKKTKNIAYERVEISACRVNDTLKHSRIHIYII